MCDGYDTGDYFHINWGWGGMSNGYFLITALNPTVQGTGGSSSGYNIGQDMLIGLRRPVEGSEIVPSLLFMSGFDVEEPDVKRHQSPKVAVVDNQGIASGAVATIDVRPGMKLISESGEVSYIEGESTVKLDMGQGVKGYYIDTDRFPRNGTYTASPAFADHNGQWHDALVVMGGNQSLKVECSHSELKFSRVAATSLKATDVNVATAIYAGEEFKLTATLTASGGEYYGEVAPMLTLYGQEVAVATPIAVDLSDGESKEFEWISSFSSEVYPGIYALTLLTQQGQTISDPMDVMVNGALPEEPAAFATAVHLNATRSGNGSSDNPYELDFAKFEATITVECESGYFGQTVSGCMFVDTHTMVQTVPGTFVGIEQGSHTDVTLRADLSNLDGNRVYMFVPWASQQGQLGNPVYVRSSQAGITGVEADRDIAGIRVYTLDGVTRLSIDCDGSSRPDAEINGLPTGIYLLEVKYDDGTVVCNKVIKR